MELKEVFQIIKSKLWLIIAIILFSVSIAVYLTINQKIKFETSTIITVQASREKTEQYQYGGFYSIQASDLFINTIMGWVKTPNFAAEIYKKSDIYFDQEKIKSLGKNIYAQKIPPQNMILKVTEKNKDDSRKIVENTIILIKEKTKELSLVADSATDFEIINSEPITNPVKVNLLFNLIISFVFSLILSLMLVFFIEYLSPTINNNQKVKNIFKKTPISLKGIKIKSLVNQESKESEKFRFIRSNISSDEKEEKEMIVVAGIGDKTKSPLIASNLALSYARSGKKTILIDADFVNPSIHEYFAKANESGFSEFLFDENNIEKYLQKTDENNLKLISAGIKLSYASDTIERSNLDKVFEEVKKKSDILVISVPSLNQSSEAFPLFSKIKKVLLVVKIGKTNLSGAKYINSFLDKKEVEKNIVVV